MVTKVSEVPLKYLHSFACFKTSSRKVMDFGHLFDCDAIETAKAECFSGSDRYQSNTAFTFWLIFLR